MCRKRKWTSEMLNFCKWWWWCGVWQDRADVTFQNNFLFQKYKTAMTCIAIEWEKKILFGTSGKVCTHPKFGHFYQHLPTFKYLEIWRKFINFIRKLEIWGKSFLIRRNTYLRYARASKHSKQTTFIYMKYFMLKNDRSSVFWTRRPILPIGL